LVMKSYPGSSHIFGEALLKVDDFLSGIPYGASFLVSEVRGAGQMKRRLEMIINEQIAPRLARKTHFGLVISALAILPLSAQEPQHNTKASGNNSDSGKSPVSESKEVKTPRSTQQTQEVSVENILAAWQLQDNSISTATFKFSLVKVESPLFGPMSVFDAIDDDDKDSLIPETLKSEINFSISGMKIACTKHSEYRDKPSSPLTTRERRIGFDGHETRLLFVKHKDMPYPMGIIRSGKVPSGMLLKDPELMPLFLACKPYAYVPSRGFSLDGAKIVERDAIYNGVEAIKLLVPNDKVVTVTSGAGTFTLTALKALYVRASDPKYADKTHTYGMTLGELKDLMELASDPKHKSDTRRAIIYVSRDKGHRILGLVEERKGVKLNEETLNYSSIDRIGWTLSGWLSTHVDPSGVPLLKMTGKVMEAGLGQPIDNSLFRPVFPVGTHLTVDNEHFMQEAGDVLRLMRVGEYGRIPGSQPAR